MENENGEHPSIQEAMPIRWEHALTQYILYSLLYFEADNTHFEGGISYHQTYK
jgi:hypothetical protein